MGCRYDGICCCGGGGLLSGAGMAVWMVLGLVIQQTIISQQSLNLTKGFVCGFGRPLLCGSSSNKVIPILGWSI